MATIFTVPTSGTTVTVKAGSFNMHGREMKRSVKITVRRVDVYPQYMTIVGELPNGEIGYRRITDPNMIDWK